MNIFEKEGKKGRKKEEKWKEEGGRKVRKKEKERKEDRWAWFPN